MKITRNQLRRLIKEELGHLLEQVAPVEPGAMTYNDWYQSMLGHDDWHKMVGVGIGHNPGQAKDQAVQHATRRIEGAGLVAGMNPAEVIGERDPALFNDDEDDRVAVAVTLGYVDEEMIISTRRPWWR